jgi:hypothetical protein
MNDSIYQTSDYLLITTLLYFGFETTNINRANPKRIVFEFNKTKELENRIQELWDNKLKVNPMEFTQKQNLIKQMIYGGNKNEY